MSRRLVTGLSLVCVVTALLWGRGPLRQAESEAAPIGFLDSILVERDDLFRRMLVREGMLPDTNSKDWKRISEDVGLMVLADPYYGRRARLFVRDAGRWRPVGVDGPEDIARIVAAR